jgi:hypothetical protein
VAKALSHFRFLSHISAPNGSSSPSSLIACSHVFPARPLQSRVSPPLLTRLPSRHISPVRPLSSPAHVSCRHCSPIPLLCSPPRMPSQHCSPVSPQSSPANTSRSPSPPISPNCSPAPLLPWPATPPCQSPFPSPCPSVIGRPLRSGLACSRAAPGLGLVCLRPPPPPLAPPIRVLPHTPLAIRVLHPLCMCSVSSPSRLHGPYALSPLPGPLLPIPSHRHPCLIEKMRSRALWIAACGSVHVLQPGLSLLRSLQMPPSPPQKP